MEPPADGTGVAKLLRLAAMGEPLGRIVEAAARELAQVTGADRAGVWILTEGQQAVLRGTVIEIGGAQIPERWLVLDPKVPALRSLLESGVEESLLTRHDSEQMRLGPLAGTGAALWLPIQALKKTVGIALVAWKCEKATVESFAARAIADALGLAIAAGMDAEKQPSYVGSAAGADAVSRALVAEAETSSLAEASDAGIILYDATGRIRLVNDRFAQLVGLSSHMLSNCRSWRDLTAAVSVRFRDPATALQRWREIADRPGEASWDEIEVAAPEPRTIERFVRPVRDATGDLVGRLEIYRDSASQRQRQTSLMQTEKMAGLGQLISSIAHELNNPLTGIMGYAQLLLGRRLSPPQAADARLIYEEAERATRIVKNLLHFARAARPERGPAQLNEIAEKTLALRNYELRVENIRLSLDLDPDLPVVVGNPAQLQQVFLNLVINAEQAIHQGTGERSIFVRTWQPSPGRVALEIADTGPGIPPEVMPHIFDPFFTTKPPGVGTGLGLSIAFGIVQNHGGEISVGSTPGHGAGFRIELPAAPPALRSAEPGDKQTGKGAHPRAGRASERILVVEDEPTVAHLIADVLGEDGYPVEIVLEGEEGLQRALAGNYDLLICDMKMPRLDGRAFYRELVARGSPLQHRLVFMTGDTLSPRTTEFLETSGVPYLAKPFLVEELKAIVTSALDSAAKAEEAEQSLGLPRAINGSR